MGVYHSGEKKVQDQAGVRDLAEHLAGVIRPEIPSFARSFLEAQHILIISTLDSSKRPWASLLFGSPGFVSTPDERTVDIRTLPIPGDPLESNLMQGSPVGLLAIDFSTRRRAKIKGKILLTSDPIQIKTERVYSLCPKYIQRRFVKDHSPHLLRR